MTDLKYPEITVNILGVNGNAFNILGICTSEMRKHKLPKSEIDAFSKKQQAAVMMICFVLL